MVETPTQVELAIVAGDAKCGNAGRCAGGTVTLAVALLAGLLGCRLDTRGLASVADAGRRSAVAVPADAGGRDGQGTRDVRPSDAGLPSRQDAGPAEGSFARSDADAAAVVGSTDVPMDVAGAPFDTGSAPLSTAPLADVTDAGAEGSDASDASGMAADAGAGRSEDAGSRGDLAEDGRGPPDAHDGLADGPPEALPVGLPASCSKPGCNAAPSVQPQPTAAGAIGNVTLHATHASRSGACLYGSTSIMYYAGIDVNLADGDGQRQWQDGRICGQCMEVTILTSQGLKRVVVRIMDKCAGTNCGLSLGGAAATEVMVDGPGRYQGEWHPVGCAGHPEVFDGEPGIFVKEGSSSGWAAIQVRNPMAAVSAISWQSMADPERGGVFASAGRDLENYYLVPAEVLLGSGDHEITVHYADGSSAKVSVTPAQLATPSASYPLT